MLFDTHDYGFWHVQPPSQLGCFLVKDLCLQVLHCVPICRRARLYVQAVFRQLRETAG